MRLNRIEIQKLRSIDPINASKLPANGTVKQKLTEH